MISFGRFTILYYFLSSAAQSLSLHSKSHTCRREVLSSVVRAAGEILSPAILLAPNQQAGAACLPGDLSKECIGVYKIPLEDAQNSRTLNTPEAVKKNAPDLNYVKPMAMPSNVGQAKEILETQRAAADDIKNVVLAGKLEEAGIKVLNLIPKVTAASKTIQEQVEKMYPLDGSVVNQMRVTKFNEQRQELITVWSQVDIEIGQALRGQMGQTTVAQIELLKSIRGATAILDDYLSAVDANST